MRATRLLEYAVSFHPAEVLDLAVGPGRHAQCFIANGAKVTGVDVSPAKFEHPKYTHIQESYETLDLDKKFDMIWCCHTLEHIPNVQHFLVSLSKWLKDDGLLAISVPPAFQNRLHVGHLTLWTPAHLVYNLIHAGWDCRMAEWYTEYCTIGLMVRKTKDVNDDGKTYMPSETLWLNQYTPIVVNHEDNAWWPNRWPEETLPVAQDPPHVTAGYQQTNLEPVQQLAFGPNPKLRKEPGTWES
jgi:SAM-dependent methyltransferase